MIIPLKSLDRHKYKEDLLEKVRFAVLSFPELYDETIYVGILSDKAWHDGSADPVNMIIKFKIDKKPTNVLVFHELAHLAIYKLRQRGKKVPKTEEFCSIFAMSRIPPEEVDADYIPYIGSFKVPKEKVPELCRKALEYRKRNRYYIKYLREVISQC